MSNYVEDTQGWRLNNKERSAKRYEKNKQKMAEHFKHYYINVTRPKLRAARGLPPLPIEKCASPDLDSDSDSDYEDHHVTLKTLADESKTVEVCIAAVRIAPREIQYVPAKFISEVLKAQ